MSDEEDDYLSENVLAGIVAQSSSGSSIPSEDGRRSLNLRFETSQGGQDPRKKSKERTWKRLKRAWGLACLSGRNWARLEDKARQ